MQLRVTVKKRDIDDAKLRLCDNEYRCEVCPIAQAVKRLFPLDEVVVGSNWVRVGTAERSYHKYELPQAAQNFIQEFDWSGKAYPFSFLLNLDADITKH
jgi:hypothetical protein